MYSLSCANGYHDVTNFEVHRIMQKNGIPHERNLTFLRYKKILKLCIRWYMLNSYRNRQASYWKNERMYYLEFKKGL